MCWFVKSRNSGSCGGWESFSAVSEWEVGYTLTSVSQRQMTQTTIEALLLLLRRQNHDHTYTYLLGWSQMTWRKATWCQTEQPGFEPGTQLLYGQSTNQQTNMLLLKNLNQGNWCLPWFKFLRITVTNITENHHIYAECCNIDVALDKCNRVSGVKA